MSESRKWQNIGTVVRTYDHPEANGRTPLPGETEYPLSFRLDTGEVLTVRMGQRGFDVVSNLLVDMMSNAPSHDDGSLTALVVGDRVCIGIKEPIPVGILTAINQANTGFPYEVEWARADGSKYRTDCGHQLRKAKP